MTAIDFLAAKPVTLTASWWHTDQQPEPGHFIVPSGQRARAAYQIFEVRFNTRRTPASYARLKCWRVRREQIPAGAVVHGWEWSKR